MDSTIERTELLPRSASVSPLHPSIGRQPSFVVLSTYPPTQCGLATFAAALFGGLQEVGVTHCGVVQVGNEVSGFSQPEVVAHLTPSSQSRVNVARIVNSYDVLLVQHEFGIFSGQDGVDVLELLNDVHIPVVVTLHTVPLTPTAHQRYVFEALMERADAAVAMTEVAHDRCVVNFNVDPHRVVTIPHGATIPTVTPIQKDGTISLLTWGLLGPGKGIEWVIDALAMVPELRNTVHYTVAGQTHPKVREQFGEAYREMLQRRADLLGIADMVTFDDCYRPLPSLLELVANSSCVILPYDSHDQITSGVLVDAVSAGCPVIATEFPHARELLRDGAGIVVPHADPVSLAHAIRTVARDDEAVQGMRELASQIALRHRWSAVAAQYVEVGVNVLTMGQVSR